MSKRLKIAYVLWALSIFTFLFSIFNGKLNEMIGGCILIAIIGLYFYKTKNKEPKPKKNNNSRISGYSLANLPNNEPIISHEIDIDPVNNIISILKRNRYGDKWAGLSMKEAKEDIKTRYEDYYFEFEPWEVGAIIEYPTFKNGESYSEKDIKSTSYFDIYLDEEKANKTFLGSSDILNSKEIQEELLKEGGVRLTFYVYGGNCMFLNLFNELEVTKGIELEYKVGIDK